MYITGSNVLYQHIHIAKFVTINLQNYSYGILKTTLEYKTRRSRYSNTINVAIIELDIILGNDM